MGASAYVELNSGVHTGFHANAYESGVDGGNNRSSAHTDWWATRLSSTAHYDNPSVTCQPTIAGVGTLGATNYTLSPAGTTGTNFFSYGSDNWVAHNPDGTGSSAVALYAAIPSYGSGSDGTYWYALTPIGPAAPSTPTLGTTGATTQALSWARGSGYSDPSSYTVQWSKDGWTSIAGSANVGGATSYTVTGLTPGTVYSYRIVAANASGSATSGSVSARTTGALHVYDTDGTAKTMLLYVFDTDGSAKLLVPYVFDTDGTAKVLG